MNSHQFSQRQASPSRRNPLQMAVAATVTCALLTLSACAPNAAPTAGYASSESAYAAPAAQEVVGAAAPQDMYFADYGVNGFVASATDNLSTFGVDVDSGAYTLARSYLNDGNLPPQEAVRVEEFVNFFDYGYAYPTAEQTFAIELAAAPSPFTQNPDSRILRVGIQGYDIPAEERQDVALTFVIDVSGSMDMDNRLGLVKRSLAGLVEELRPSDSVGIVVYGSTAWVVLPVTEVGEGATILNAINSLQPEGSTNAEAGLRLAYQQAWESFNPQALNRVILLSDGVANVGETGPEVILDEIGQYAAKGIYLTTVGVGMGNYNDVLMEQLADQGDGFYAYVDSDEQARKLFVHDLTGTLQTIAKDAKVQVEFNPATVARYRLLGYENRAVADDDFRNDEVDGGEIGAGHSVTALYELELQGNAQRAQEPIATVYLRWLHPESGEAREISQELTGDAVQRVFAESDPSLQLATVVAAYAEILRDSEWAEQVTLGTVLSEAQRVSDLLAEEDSADAAVSELVDLVWRANQIAGGRAGQQ